MPKTTYSNGNLGRFQDNQGVWQEDGYVLKSQMEQSFWDVSADLLALVNDLREMDQTLKESIAVINSQAYTIGALAKAITDAGIATNDELKATMMKMHKKVSAMRKAADEQVN